MLSKHKLLFFALLFGIFFFVFVSGAKAATIMLIPENKAVSIGQEISVFVKIDSEGESINAAQGTIIIPTDILEITKVDTTNSIFNFWIEEPKASSEGSMVRFIGGTPKGVAGKGLEVLRLDFKAKGVGSKEIGLSDVVITANDGKGTNILSRVDSLIVTVGALTATISTPTPVVPPTVPVAQPQVLDRPATLAKNLPINPVITVPLYSDVLKWYNHLGDTIVFWEVPEDVTAVAVSMNENPNTIPTTAEKVLSTGKNFGPITEGVWYVHARFKNNIGWGGTTHFKISLDTTPPLPFEINMEAAISEDPSPKITFTAVDEFSGISHALIFIDGQEVANTIETTFMLPVQAPGEHALLVRIFDLAGSSVEDDLKFEVLPLPVPIIEFISETVSQGEYVFAAGTSIPNAFVDVFVVNKLNQEVFRSTVQSDNSGNWKITIDKSLPTGKYIFSAMARDERGASSQVAGEASFKIKPKIIITFGNIINLGWLEIFIILILLVAVGVSLTSWWYVAKKNTREAYKIIIGRDIEKLADTLSASLISLESNEKLAEPSRSVNMTEHIKRMRLTIMKIKKYIVDQGITKLK